MLFRIVLRILFSVPTIRMFSLPKTDRMKVAAIILNNSRKPNTDITRRSQNNTNVSLEKVNVL